MSECYVANRAVVAHEAFDEETVLINFERGTYFSLLDQLCDEGCLLRTDIEDATARDPCVMPIGDFTPPVVEAFHDLAVLMGSEILPSVYEHDIRTWPTPAQTTTAMAD